MKNSETADVEFRLPVLPTDSLFPGDYRSKSELRVALNESKIREN